MILRIIESLRKKPHLKKKKISSFSTARAVLNFRDTQYVGVLTLVKKKKSAVASHLSTADEQHKILFFPQSADIGSTCSQGLFRGGHIRSAGSLRAQL